MGNVDLLVEQNMDLVQQIACKRFAARLPDDDLIQQGNIGLWEAAQRWDGSGDFRAYARVCIYHNMIDYTRKPSRPVGEWPMTDEDGEEVMYYDDLATMELCSDIDRVWPQGSQENEVLSWLAIGLDKRSVAERMGLDVRRVARIAKRAVKAVQSVRGQNKPVGE